MTHALWRHLPVLIGATGVLLFAPSFLHAQDESERPEESEPPAEELLLADFGTGLRAFAATLEDTDIDIEELKVLYAAAQEALQPDPGMTIFVEGHEAKQQQDHLREFRVALQDQVINGSMSRDEALANWLEVVDVRFFHNFAKDTVDWSERLVAADRSGHLAPIRLRIPEAGDVRILIRPEVLGRDLKFFSEELELDESTRAVVKTLLKDYVDTYQLRAKELKDAILDARRQIGRASMLARAGDASDTLERIATSINWSDVQVRVEERFEGTPNQDRMMGALERFEDSFTGIRQALERRQVDLGRTLVDPEDSKRVLQLAAALQADRRGMREELIESFALILDDDQQEMIQDLFDRLALEQGRIDGRFGGSGINLHVALDEALGEEPMGEAIRESLESTTSQLLQLLDRWTEARIDRERAGLELFVAYEQDDESGIGTLTATLGQKARTELTAALAIRDLLLAARSELESMLARANPETAARFRKITNLQGFKPQMRQRWSERAIDTVLTCSDLEIEQEAALTTYATELNARLEPLRMQAIQARLIDEPRIARSEIDRMVGRARSRAIEINDWHEPGAEAFRAVDEAIDLNLNDLLTGGTCLDTIPRRRGKTPPPGTSNTRDGQRRRR